MAPIRFPKIAQLKSVYQFRERLRELQLDLPVEDALDEPSSHSPLGQRMVFGNKIIGNRWCVHPMEGWDSNRDGSPSEKTFRRWRRFGESGAKLIWGGEAVAVRQDGRANPNQLLATPSHLEGLAALKKALVDEHRKHFSSTDDLVIGLQLTHSGRYARPNDSKLEPQVAYHHPLLDKKVGIDPSDDSCIWTDDALDRLVDDFVSAAKIAAMAGFDFVDVKACHGYLLHEMLSGFTRSGKYGGSFENRMRLIESIIEAIQAECPRMAIGVRLSVYDCPPFIQGDECGSPEDFQTYLPYQFGFGMNPVNPLQIDLTEPIQLLERLRNLNVVAVNLTCGSPYYTPHIQRPAAFPPSDGYFPPEDPLIGVHRQIATAAKCKTAVPDLIMVGSGYSYLQEYLPNVAQAVIRAGWIDAVGIGRMVLSYPTLPVDTLRGAKLVRVKICRTFSDCTTAPRNGIVSGCYPLDPFYKESSDAKRVRERRPSQQE